MLDVIIDKLTRSIEERATGRVLDTEVRPARRMGSSERIFLDTRTAARLVETYFGEK
jgi:hypothetical protein